MTTIAPPEATHLGDTYYNVEQANEYWAERCETHTHPTASSQINGPGLENIRFLIPSMDAIAERHGKRLVLGSFDFLDRPPASFHRTAGIEADDDAILVAHYGVLAPSDHSRIINHDVEGHNRCIRGCHPIVTADYNDGYPYPNWFLDSTTCALGNLAYRIITFPFWWHNSSTSQGRLDQFRKSFEAALLMSLDRDLHAATIEAAANELRDRAAEMMTRHSSENIEQLRTEVVETVARQAEYEERIMANARRLDEIRVQLEALDERALDEDELKQKVQVELNQLEENQHVVTTRINDHGNLVVNTDQLTMRTPDGEHANAGEFQLTIDFEAPSLAVHNMTRRLGSYDHPHVSEGAFCTGDQRRIVNQLMERGEIAATVAIIIDLLQQVNPADTYTSEWRAWFDLDQ